MTKKDCEKREKLQNQPESKNRRLSKTSNNVDLKYAIYGIVFEQPKPDFKWIKKELDEKLKDRIRKSVVGVSDEDIPIEIMEEGAEEKDANIFQFLITKFKELCVESFKENENENAHKNNILQIWDTEPKNSETRRKSKQGPSKINIQKKAFQNAGHLCSMEKISVHPIGPRRDVGYDRNKIDKGKMLIIDYPEDNNIDFYIMMLGNFDYNIFLSLLKNKFPLRGLLYFYSNNAEKIESADKTLLIFSEFTKYISIVDEFIEPLSRCLAEKYSKDIFDKFCYYLYDQHLLELEYKQYITNFIEIDVDIKEKIRPLDRSILLVKNWEDFLPDEIIVPIYLNSLIEKTCKELGKIPRTQGQVESSKKKRKDERQMKRKIIDSEIIFLKHNFENYTFTNDCNEILKIMRSCNIDIGSYELFLKFLLMKINLKSLNSLKKSTNMCSAFKLKKELDRNLDSVYIELMSENAFLQRMKNLRNHSNEFLEEIEPNENVAYFLDFHKKLLVENTTFVIPTKLCFRDYLIYLKPNVVEDKTIESVCSKFENTLKEGASELPQQVFLRQNSLKSQRTFISENQDIITQNSEPEQNEDIEECSVSSKKRKIFNGYNLGDTQLQLCSLDLFYNSTQNFSLHFEKLEWLNGSKHCRLNFNILGNQIYFNQFFSKPKFEFRVLTKNHCSIRVVFFTSVEDDKISKVDIICPNGLNIKAKYSWTNEQIIELEQIKQNNELGEERRMFNEDGSTIIFYKNNIVNLFYPNGTVYQTHAPNINNRNCTLKTTPTAIKFIEKYKNILDHYNFTLIKSNGEISEAVNGTIDEKGEIFFTEWYDFIRGEILSTREDNVKFIWSTDNFKVYYPDGTMILTRLKEKELFESLHDSSKDVLTTEDFPSDIAYVTHSILEEIFDISLQNLFVDCPVEYTIQNREYASVMLDNDKKVIKTPEFILQFNGKKGHLLIGENIAIDFDSLGVKINLDYQNERSMAVISTENSFEPIANIFENEFHTLSISFDDYWYACFDKKSNCNHLLVQEASNDGGFEVLNESDAHLIQEKYQTNNTYLVVEPIKSFNEIFQCKCIETHTFLEKFIKYRYCCGLSNQPVEKLRHMTYRYIFKIEREPEKDVLLIPNVKVNVIELKNMFENYLISISEEDRRRNKKAREKGREYYVQYYDKLKNQKVLVHELLRNNCFPKYFDKNSF